MMWMSEAYQQNFAIDRNCLQQKAQQEPISQDNLFHTLLGMFDIHTREYQSGLDLLASCKKTV